MKRSKMVGALIDAASRLGFAVEYTEASAILGRLEHEGMLPPNTYKNKQVGPVVYVNEPANEWDPEDETN